MKLQQLRQQIDQLDSQILELLNQRLGLAGQIASAKVQTGQEIFDPERERRVFARLAQLNKGPMPQVSLDAIYREIIAASRSLQKGFVIGCVGSCKGEAHRVAREVFGPSCQFHFYRTHASADAACQSGRCDFWVTPRQPSSSHHVRMIWDIAPDKAWVIGVQKST